MREIAYKSEDFNTNYINKNRKKYLIFLEYSLMKNKYDNAFYKDELIDRIHLVNYIITDLNLNIKCVKTFIFNDDESDLVKEKEVKEIRADIRQSNTTICKHDELDSLLSNLKISFANPQDINFFNIEEKIISGQDENITLKAFTETVNTYKFIKSKDMQEKLENNTGGIFLSVTPFRYLLIFKKAVFDKYLEEYLNISKVVEKQYEEDYLDETEDIIDDMMFGMIGMFCDDDDDDDYYK